MSLEARVREAERWSKMGEYFATNVKEYGIEAGRSLFILNGGALAGLGALLSRPEFSNAALKAEKFYVSWHPAYFFALGALFAAGVFLSAYLNFWFLYAGLPGPPGLRDFEETGAIGAWTEHKKKVSATFWIALISGILSAVCFAFASFWVALSL